MKNISLHNVDALLITSPTNIRYLTGFVGAAPEERESYVLLTRSRAYLFTNALYREDAKNLTQNSPSFKRLNLVGSLAIQGLTFIEISRVEPFAKKLNEILTLASGRQLALRSYRLGFEEMDLTVAEYGKLRKELPNITLVPTRNKIEELRMIKRLDEIENIRAAANITDLCFSFILGKLKPGLPSDLSAEALANVEGLSKGEITESEIAWEIESFIKTHGADLAFSPIVAFGSNSSQPHYSPSKNGALRHAKSNQSQALKSNDIVLLDFGARINGYCSDMTRMVFIGNPKAEWVKAYETVLRAQTAALEYLASSLPAVASAKEGPDFSNTIGINADQIARDVIEKAGFPTYPHSLGHGVGLDIHEAPRLRVNPSTRSARSGLQTGPSENLRAGMVVTVEPGIYMEGQYGIRIEDLILLKEDGIEVLSKSNKNVIVL